MTSPWPSSLAARLAERIRREGPITFDRFMAAALYDPDGGFFTRGGGAGRAAGDFLTSPEVGSLFGLLVARALDRWWDQLGRPDPYVVVDAGAGRGQLCRDVLRARPACAPALRYVMVERSPVLRARQHEYLQVEPPDEALGPAVRTGKDDEPEPVPGSGPIVTAMEDFPAATFTGTVVANELLDNLPFRIVERRGEGWDEVRVGVEAGRFREVTVPAEPELLEDVVRLLGEAAGRVPEGARLPLQVGVSDWLDQCGRALHRGFVALLDYADEAAHIAERGPAQWLRTYRDHDRGSSPLEDPGEQDITADVVLETVRAAARREGFEVVEEVTQAAWLAELGVDRLVEEAKETWRERAHLGDLEAMAARSRVVEAEALVHPAGLGAHRVVILSKGL